MSERIGDTPAAPNSNSKLLWIILTLIVVVSALAAVWWLQSDSSDEANALVTLPESVPEPAQQPQPIQRLQPAPPPPTPDIPVQEVTKEPAAPKPKPLPPLADSDTVIKNHFGPMSDSIDYQLMWQPNQLVQRWVTVIDGAAQGKIIRGVIPLPTPKQKFPVVKRGPRYFLDENGFTRFDPVIDLIIGLDANLLVKGFHRFRPLIEEAYSQLGFTPDQFDNMLIKLLDQLINFHPIEGPIELKSSSVNYTFADTKLEKLTSIEKLLVRMGPQNSNKLKRYAVELKTRLIDGHL